MSEVDYGSVWYNSITSRKIPPQDIEPVRRYERWCLLKPPENLAGQSTCAGTEAQTRCACSKSVRENAC